jgi:hypothetical protein
MSNWRKDIGAITLFVEDTGYVWEIATELPGQPA